MKGWKRMVDTRKWRTAVFLMFLLLLGGVLLFCKYTEERSCMKVPILSEAQQKQLGRYEDSDLSWDLQYNGQRVAVDLGSSTIYISQNILPGLTIPLLSIKGMSMFRYS